MCMKNVNINTLTFRRIGNNIASMQVYDTIVPETDSGKTILRDFNVLIATSVVFPNDATGVDPFESIVAEQSYDVQIRLTHIQSNSGFELDSYTFTLDASNIKKVCRSIYESKKIITIPNLVLQAGLGLYAIKVFIKNRRDTTWFTQSIQPFRVVSER